MKDWLILLCIGLIAVLLFRESSHRTASAMVTPDEQTVSTPKAEPVPANSLPGEPAPPARPETDTQAALVAGSQRAALTKYPALGVAGSAVNVRFTSHYKSMVADHDPRLQDPTWPMQLAEECALAAGTPPAADPPAPATVRAPTVAALPTSSTSSGDKPAPSLRAAQPVTAPPQTLVFHPAVSIPPTVAAGGASALVPGVKSTGALPFVTMDAVNQSSGNHYNYNYSSYYWYDISFRQSVGIAIKVRNMGRESAAVNLRWIFFARRAGGNDRFIFGASGKEIDLTPGQNVDVDAASPVVASREVNDSWISGTRYLSGSKYEGWLVQLVERGGGNRVIKQTGSTSYLEDLARKTDFTARIEDFRSRNHSPAGAEGL